MNEAARALVLEHRAWADRIGRRLARKHFSLDPDDFAGAAMLGLVGAAMRYRPGRGADFKAFARSRVTGAVMDFHRTFDLLTRDERRAVRQGRETKWMLRRGYVMPRQHTEDVRDLAQDTNAFASVARALSKAPEQEAAVRKAEARAAVRAAVETLPPRLAEAVRRHYLGGENLERVGMAMGVTQSRACQLVKQALSQLRPLEELRDHLGD